MPVRTKRLARGITGPANAGEFVYTCPDEETTILKDVRIFARLGAAVCDVVLESSGVFVQIIHQSLASLDEAQRTGFIVLQPGDSVLVQCDVAQGMAYWLSGSQLEGTAD